MSIQSTHARTISYGAWARWRADKVRPRAVRLQTDYAAVLVQQLRARHLPAPTREYRFQGPGGRRWRFDLAWPSDLLAVEIQGGEWVQGRHNRGGGMAKDNEKWNTATLSGWTVLLVTGSQVRSGYALQLLNEVLT